MLKLIAFPLRLFLFWLLLTNFFRLTLLVTQYFFSALPIAESLLVFSSGFMLDLSMICYISIIPLLLYFIFQYTNSSVLKYVTHGICYLFIVLVILISIANIILLKQWGTLINYRALTYLDDVQTAFASVNNLQLVALIAILILVIYASVKVYNFTVRPFFEKCKTSTLVKSAVAAVLIVLTGAYTRGGFQEIPINESAAYFSTNNKLNLIATNPQWHLMHSILQASKGNNNAYKFYDDDVAEKITEGLVVKTDTLPQLFTQKKPNIVFVLLESFTADAVFELGGDTGVAPNLGNLIREGLFFTRIYSSGARTDVALPSVFSGFPAQPNHSIMRFTEKTAKLPSVLKPFKNSGYHTSFYYGGDLKFSNMLSYLTTVGFEKIVGKDDFDSKQFNSKWGAQDEFVFARHFADMGNLKEPFFSAVLTLSSHEPYESPMQSPFSTINEAGKFKNVLWYTDYCLGKYFENARKTAWYKNTIFIVMADHGNGLLKKRSFYETGLRHIPLVVLGEPLMPFYKGKQIKGTGGQHDIATTLLTQLNFDTGEFVFSNNLLNPERKNYAYQNMDDAVGWVTDSCSFVYNTEQKRFLEREPEGCEADTFTAKAYMQSIYNRFIGY
ncbi:MAG TPA: LTA synthase family protein [Bacteroidia bacterium]|nr:LTA synthase family protein [Bacteroidia bacterium]HNU33915.1 LTA synthase family protein [Bacteroidia bacterium]